MMIAGATTVQRQLVRRSLHGMGLANQLGGTVTHLLDDAGPVAIRWRSISITEPMPDPKLKTAMEEIKAILDKHDIAAVVQLQSQQGGEFLYWLSPSWSCVTLTDEGQCRVKAAAKTGGPEEKQRLVDAIGMLMCFHDAAKKTQENMNQVVEMIVKHGVKFSHFTREE